MNLLERPQEMERRQVRSPRHIAQCYWFMKVRMDECDPEPYAAVQLAAGRGFNGGNGLAGSPFPTLKPQQTNHEPMQLLFQPRVLRASRVDHPLNLAQDRRHRVLMFPKVLVKLGRWTPVSGWIAEQGLGRSQQTVLDSLCKSWPEKN
jgi:hypothetical protein